MKSVFLWSEDEARQHRKQQPEPRGLYLTLEQGAILTRPIQSVLFGFVGEGSESRVKLTSRLSPARRWMRRKPRRL